MNMNKIIIEDSFSYRKGHDLEFMVALETHMKVVRWKIDIGLCVIVDLRLLFNDIHGRTLNQMICHCHQKFMQILLRHNKSVVYEAL